MLLVFAIIATPHVFFVNRSHAPDFSCSTLTYTVLIFKELNAFSSKPATPLFLYHFLPFGLNIL